jgi:hypothetical protein
MNNTENALRKLPQNLELDSKVDFVEENLSEYDLREISLIDANLNHARFDQSDLTGANLSNSNLTGANLSNANLTGANLSNANLTGADLRNSNLEGINLTGATIKGTHLNGANVGNTVPEAVQVYFHERELPKTPIADDELKSLVENFCSQERNTRQSTIATHKLLQAIQSLPQLRRSYQPETSFFSIDFEEILNETLLEVTERICGEFIPDEIDYTRSLVKWINYKLRLYYKPKDKLREASRHKTLSLDRYIDGEENSTFLDLLDNYEDGETLNTIDGIIEQAQQERRHRLGKEVDQYLWDDPDNRLKDCSSKKHPRCECHLLVKKRLLSNPPVSFQAIADELGIKFGTLTGHWAYKCKPLLDEIAQKLEKNLPEDID